jgi:hypothetical protein
MPRPARAIPADVRQRPALSNGKAPAVSPSLSLSRNDHGQVIPLGSLAASMRPDELAVDDPPSLDLAAVDDQLPQGRAVLRLTHVWV